SRCFPISLLPFPDMSPPPEPPPAPLSSPTPPEPPDPPDPQIRLSSGEAHTQSLLLQLLTCSQQVHSISEPSPPPPSRFFVLLSIAVLAPRRSSRRHEMVLHSRSSNSDLGLVVDKLSDPINLHPIAFPQVCSCYSLSYSYTLASYWMNVEIMVLALWNSDLILTPLWILDILGSIFVLSRGTLIDLVRNFTAVCRFYFNFVEVGFTHSIALWQIGKRSLLSFTVPVFLTVLLGVEARIVVQDSFRSAIVDCLALEALFPPACGFGKDYRFEDDYLIDGLCLVSALVELFSSPLSVCLYLSFVASFSFLSYAITLLVGSAPCSLDVSFFI
ncbi:unnamed protein product, partial [Arabidopsis halleri]